jgi:hypothetical protein
LEQDQTEQTEARGFTHLYFLCFPLLEWQGGAEMDLGQGRWRLEKNQLERVDTARGALLRLSLNKHMPRSFTSHIVVVFALCALVSAAFAPRLHAIERRFTYTYETTPSPRGHVELENWVTWKHTDAPGANDADLFQFRHELEFGVTDRFQIGLYVFDWRYDEHEREDHSAEWEHSGVELIYNLSNPTTDFIGSALYLEALVGERSFELEGKLLLQKNFGPITAAYNLVLEAEWEGDQFGNFDEREGEFAQVLGVSYDITKSFSVGAEILHEIPIPDWREAEDSVVWAGPNASIRFGRAFATVTALFQVTEVDGEPDAQVRLITGFDF